MKLFFKRIEKTLIFSIKALMFVFLFLAFFVPYMPQLTWFPDIPGIVNLSRTAAICMTTFAVLGICFIKIYGGFAVGIKKSKEITYSVFLASVVTDFLTWIFLIIMSAELITDRRFNIFEMIPPLVVTIFVQYVIIFAFTRFGNFVFFKINDPKTVVVVYDSEDSLQSYISKIGKYKKQWTVKSVVHYKSDDLYSVISEHETVFMFDVPHGIRGPIIEYCYANNKNIYLSPDVADVIVKYSKQEILDDTTIFSASLRELTTEQKFIKRAVDIIVSGIGLIIASPIMLVEAVLIKSYDKGPAFFKQERMTKDGKKFNVLKFRTMIVDAEKDNVAVLSSKNDSRITPVGKVLRATRLDELPQLLNIFLGDMSFVGPRPERESIAEEYLKTLPQFEYRLKVKAGLTGLAQIMGKYNTTPKDKLTMDLVYIEQYSIWLDFKILLQTLRIIFKSDSTEGFDQTDKVEFVKHEEISDTEK